MSAPWRTSAHITVLVRRPPEAAQQWLSALALVAAVASCGQEGDSTGSGGATPAEDGTPPVDTVADAGGDGEQHPPDASADPTGSGGTVSTDAGPQGGGGACSFPLSSYALEQSFSLSEVPAEGSGITWNRDTQTFFVVANLQGAIWEYDRGLQTLLRTITLQDLDADTEGLAYLQDGWLAIATEANLVYVAQVTASTANISGSDGGVQVYQPAAAPPVSNAGLEGIAYRQPRDGAPGRIFVCQEYSPMRVLQFDHVLGTEPYSQRSYADGTLAVEEPWDAEQVLSGEVTDLAGMAYDNVSDTLLILSQESSRILRVNPGTGELLERLDLSGTSTSEGLTFFEDCRLAVMHEPNRVELFTATAD